MRAWLALREAGVVFEEEVVDIRRPQRFANLDRIGAFSPPAMVPALVVDQTVIFDSAAIMEYANEVADGVLLPEDRAARARARSLVAWQHSDRKSVVSGKRVPVRVALGGRATIKKNNQPAQQVLTDTFYLPICIPLT